MNVSNLLTGITNLFKPEETWDDSMPTHEKRWGFEIVKFLVWYVISAIGAALLCLAFR